MIQRNTISFIVSREIDPFDITPDSYKRLIDSIQKELLDADGEIDIQLFFKDNKIEGKGHRKERDKEILDRVGKSRDNYGDYHDFKYYINTKREIESFDKEKFEYIRVLQSDLKVNNSDFMALCHAQEDELYNQFNVLNPLYFIEDNYLCVGGYKNLSEEEIYHILLEDSSYPDINCSYHVYKTLCERYKNL